MNVHIYIFYSAITVKLFKNISRLIAIAFIYLFLVNNEFVCFVKVCITVCLGNEQRQQQQGSDDFYSVGEACSGCFPLKTVWLFPLLSLVSFNKQKW